MRNEEFSTICRRANTGSEVWVQNLDLLYSGRVVACHDDFVTVEAFGFRRDWGAGDCRPVTSSIDPLGPPTNQ
jgi:hypothetical protein